MLITEDAVGALRAERARIRDAMLAAEAGATARISRVSAEQRRSAVNLLQYVALPQHDARELQDDVSMRGLSSLGCAGPHVLATVEAVLAQLARTVSRVDPRSFDDDRALLRAH